MCFFILRSQSYPARTAGALGTLCWTQWRIVGRRGLRADPLRWLFKESTVHPSAALTELLSITERPANLRHDQNHRIMSAGTGSWCYVFFLFVVLFVENMRQDLFTEKSDVFTTHSPLPVTSPTSLTNQLSVHFLKHV